MGACASAEVCAAAERSAQIDKLLEEDARRLKMECKVLLLGSGKSGKSTVVKQMKITHHNGFAKDELMIYRPVVNKKRRRISTGCRECNNPVIAAARDWG